MKRMHTEEEIRSGSNEQLLKLHFKAQEANPTIELPFVASSMQMVIYRNNYLIISISSSKAIEGSGFIDGMTIGGDDATTHSYITFTDVNAGDELDFYCVPMLGTPLMEV